MDEHNSGHPAVGNYQLDKNNNTKLPVKIPASDRYEPRPPPTVEAGFPQQPSDNNTTKHSFGYCFENDYSNDRPAVGQYEVDVELRGHPNAKEVLFSTSDRTNFCREGPAVGEYDSVCDKARVRAPSFTFDRSHRFKGNSLGPGPGDYEISSDLGKHLFAKKSSPVQPRKSSVRGTPGPIYNLQRSERGGVKIGRQRRTSCFDKVPISDVHTYFSDNPESKRAAKIGKGLRPRVEKDGPAPTDYTVPARLSSTLGTFNRSIKKQQRVQSSGPADYAPNYNNLLSKGPRPTIARNQNNFDFKFVNRSVGPGLYPVDYVPKDRESHSFGRGPRMPKQRSTPGPGDYLIPGTIGALPRYVRRGQTLAMVVATAIGKQHLESTGLAK